VWNLVFDVDAMSIKAPELPPASEIRLTFIEAGEERYEAVNLFHLGPSESLEDVLKEHGHELVKRMAGFIGSGKEPLRKLFDKAKE